MDAAPWVARIVACGACEDSGDNPERTLMVAYRDGSVVWAFYGTWSTPGVTTARGLERFGPLLERAFADARVATDTTGVVVHRVATGTLSAPDHEAVAQRFTSWLQHAPDPGEPDYSGGGTAGPATVRSFGTGHEWDVTLYRNFPEGGEWHAIITQFDALASWLAQWRFP